MKTQTNVYDGVRFIGGAATWQHADTAFGRWLLGAARVPPQDPMELPAETFGYLVFAGDYHPPLSGFFLLMLAIACIAEIERSGGVAARSAGGHGAPGAARRPIAAEAKTASGAVADSAVGRAAAALGDVLHRRHLRGQVRAVQHDAEVVAVDPGGRRRHHRCVQSHLRLAPLPLVRGVRTVVALPVRGRSWPLLLEHAEARRRQNGRSRLVARGSSQIGRDYSFLEFRAGSESRVGVWSRRR